MLTFNLFSNNTDTQYAAERKYTSSTSGFSYQIGAFGSGTKPNYIFQQNKSKGCFFNITANTNNYKISKVKFIEANKTDTDFKTYLEAFSNSDPITVTVTKAGSGTATISLENPLTISDLSYSPDNYYFAYRVTSSALSFTFKAIEITYLVPDRKIDPELYFDQQEYTFTIGEEFETPVVQNCPEDLPVRYSSSDPDVAYYDGWGTLKLLKAGETVITATTDEDETYKSGTASYRLTVIDPNTAHLEDPAFTWSASTFNAYMGVSNSFPTLQDKPENLTINYASSNPSIAEIDATTGEITLKAPGETIISATSAETEQYKAKTVKYTLTVSKSEAGIAFPETAYTANLGEEFSSPILTNPNNLPITYTSSKSDVATIGEDGTVEVKALGTTTITASFAGDANFLEAIASYTLTVKDPNCFTIIFKSNGNSDASDNIASDLQGFKEFIDGDTGFITEVSGSNVYKGIHGVKFSSSKNTGSLTITLGKKVNVTSVVVKSYKYGTDSSSLKVTIGETSATKNITDNSEEGDIFEVSGETQTLKFDATKRLYVKEIEIFYKEIEARVPGEVTTDPAANEDGKIYISKDKEITLSSEDADKLEYTFVKEGEENGTTNTVNNLYKFKATENGTLTVTPLDKVGNNYPEKSLTVNILIKKEPELSFEKTTYWNTYGQTFVSPVLKCAAGLTMNDSSSEPLNSESENENNSHVIIVTFNSSNESVASVSKDGTVTIKGLGTARITATTDGSYDVEPGSAYYDVKVIDKDQKVKTIVFVSNDSDSSSALTETNFINQIENTETLTDFMEISATNTVYAGKNGLKMGSSDNAGSFTLKLKEIVDVNKILVKATKYENDKDKNASLKVNELNGDIAPEVTSYFEDAAIGQMNEISFKSNAGRVYLKEVDIIYTDVPVVSATQKTVTFNFAESNYSFKESETSGTYYLKSDPIEATLSTTNGEIAYTENLGWTLSGGENLKLNFLDGKTYNDVVITDVRFYTNLVNQTEFNVQEINKTEVNADSTEEDRPESSSIVSYGTRWIGENNSIDFAINSSKEITLKSITVTFTHNEIETPYLDWHADGEHVIIKHSSDDHNIYYKIIRSNVQNAPRRVGEDDSYEGHSLYENSAPLEIKNGDQISFYAQHPLGMRSAITNMTYNDIITGVGNVFNDENGDVMWFTPQGIRVENPGEGIYIRVLNGKATKVVR